MNMTNKNQPRMQGGTPINRRKLLVTAGLFATASQSFAQGAAYPSRPVNFVVPYPAGGFGDALSRLIAEKLASQLQQPVIIDNRPGAAGQIGASYVKQQPADGHTLFYGDIGPLAMNAALYPKVSYDVQRDFTPVGRLVIAPLLLVVPTASPIRSLADLLRASANSPGINYGSYGPGSQPHVWMEMLKRKVGGQFTHVPYKGAAPAMQDLLGARIDVMADVAANSLPMVKDAKLRAIAVIGSDSRLAALPNVPTLAELGYQELNTPGWAGIVVRSSTPEAIITKLSTAIQKVLQAPDLAQRYTPIGILLAPQSPAQFGDFIRTETQRWGQVIRAAGITLD